MYHDQDFGFLSGKFDIKSHTGFFDGENSKAPSDKFWSEDCYWI